MSSGSVSAFGAESNAISGAAFCASVVSPVKEIARNNTSKKRFMTILRLSRARGFCGLCLEHEFLHTPRLDFSDDHLVGIAAVHHMNDLESAELFAGVTEFAENRSVEFEFVDLARTCPCTRGVPVGIGVRSKHILVRPLRDANGPADSEIVICLDRLKIVIENLIAIIGSVRH